SGTYAIINISENAFQSHVDHGDASPGEPVPGMAGKKFTADCTVVDVKELIDTIIVPSNGVTVTSTAVLVSGVSYELEASGTYKFVNWATATIPDLGYADARFSYRIPSSYNSTGSPAWIDGANLIPGYPNYLQIWVNGNSFTWGTGYSETHTYVSNFTGQGSTVSFKIVDNAYGDNVGSLTVKIYRYN
ncbi:MAG: hypothetical protein AAGU05_06640, partial [Anaerolineaceae bacterium]